MKNKKVENLLSDNIEIKSAYRAAEVANDLLNFISEGVLRVLRSNYDLKKIAKSEPFSQDLVRIEFKTIPGGTRYIFSLDTYHGIGGFWRDRSTAFTRISEWVLRVTLMAKRRLSRRTLETMQTPVALLPDLKEFHSPEELFSFVEDLRRHIRNYPFFFRVVDQNYSLNDIVPSEHLHDRDIWIEVEGLPGSKRYRLEVNPKQGTGTFRLIF